MGFSNAEFGVVAEEGVAKALRNVTQATIFGRDFSKHGGLYQARCTGGLQKGETRYDVDL